MRKSIIKKLMMGALTASLVMAPVMSVAATTTTNTESVIKDAVEEAAAGATEENKTSASSSSNQSTSAVVAEIPSTSSVGGTKTSVTGVYLATSVNGSIVATSTAAIKDSYGLASNEKPYAKFSNLDAKKSPLAKQAIEWAAASQKAVVGPMLNIELGKMTAGEYSLLPAEGGAIRLTLGVPKSFAQDGKTYAMVCVRAGGAVSILADVDSNPNTITFDTTGGAGAYAIIKY